VSDSGRSVIMSVGNATWVGERERDGLE
jgi:hypothetical protein